MHLGTSGWSYDHWTSVLYPPGTSPNRRLGLYSEAFATVELNASFYRWPSDTTFASWRSRLPEGFTMAVKAPRGLTHARRLNQPEQWIERICAGLHELGDKRGPLLVQLHPAHERDDARLDWFLHKLPHWTRPAIEFRHPTWVCDDVFSLLERHEAAYVVMSGANLPCVLRRTAADVYVRLHGPDHEHLYGGSYSDDDLRWWAARIKEWEFGGAQVWAYFNNDGEGNAVRNARTLQHWYDH